MKLIILSFLICLAFQGISQDSVHIISVTADTSQRAPGEKDKVFAKVEIESSYPGGDVAWQGFLMKNMHYPKEAIKKEIQGIVVVQFIIDKDGTVEEIEAISGPLDGGLREEAIRIIKKSGKWVPAMQSGKYVKSQKRQPFVFKLG